MPVTRKATAVRLRDVSGSDKPTSAPSQFSDLRTAGSLKGAGCLEADGLSGNRTSTALHHDKFANKTKADLDLHFPTLSLHCMRTCIIPAAKEAHPRTTPRCSRSIGRNRSFKTSGSSPAAGPGLGPPRDQVSGQACRHRHCQILRWGREPGTVEKVQRHTWPLPLSWLPGGSSKLT